MGFIEKNEALIFVFLAFLFSWIFWIPYKFLGYGGGTIGLCLYQLGVLGPLVAAVEMIILSRGRDGIKDLMKGLVKWRMGIEWYVVALFLPLAIEAMVLFTIALSGVDLAISKPLVADGSTLIGQIYYALATTLAIFGFLLPRLLKSNSPLLATVFAFGFAVLWRAPLILASVNAGQGSYELWWALGNLGTFFIFAWLFRCTRGSLLLLTLFDLSLNYFRWFSRGVMQASPGGDLWGLDFSLHLFVGVIVLLACWKYFLGIAPAAAEGPEAISSG